MPQPLSGPGVGLQVPQALYPSALAINGGEIQTATNTFNLAPGEALPIPAGRWAVTCGRYSAIQYLDPVTTIWTRVRDLDNDFSMVTVLSDGFNIRIANLTGCVVAAVVTNGGNGAYVQSTTTVTPSAGNSTWQPIVGGALFTTTSITAVGANYGIAPLIFIDAPPSPGVQATAIATISSGTLSAITVLNQGAGYTTAPNMVILPNPADPNINAGITNATAVCSLTGAGSITALLCTNPGASVATTMSLTIAGAGASATATPLFLETVTGISITSGGAGYSTTATEVSTVGGYNSTTGAAWTNPLIQLYDFVPRPAYAAVTSNGAITTITSIVDGGLFITTPVALPVTSGVITTVATLALTLGGSNDSIRIQQAG